MPKAITFFFAVLAFVNLFGEAHCDTLSKGGGVMQVGKDSLLIIYRPVVSKRADKEYIKSYITKLKVPSKDFSTYTITNGEDFVLKYRGNRVIYLKVFSDSSDCEEAISFITNKRIVNLMDRYFADETFINKWIDAKKKISFCRKGNKIIMVFNKSKRFANWPNDIMNNLCELILE